MDKYRRRRQILRSIHELEPAPVTVAEIASFPLLAMGGISETALACELRELAAREYIANHRPGREPLYSITAKGRDQLQRETDPDEYIWGEYAAKFQEPFLK